MNLLNNLFNADEIEITNINKKYLIIVVITLIFTITLLFTKKNNYYHGTFTINNNDIVLLVEKDYVNKIKKTNKIIVDNIETDYSINKIMPVDSIYMISINLNPKIDNLKTGEYKVYLGKESLFEFIVRIIKK